MSTYLLIPTQKFKFMSIFKMYIKSIQISLLSFKNWITFYADEQMISVQCLALPKNLVNIQVSENLNAPKEIVLNNCVVQLMCEIRHTWLLRIPSLLSAYNCGNARAQHIILDETVTHLISQISRNRKRKNSLMF